MLPKMLPGISTLRGPTMRSFLSRQWQTWPVISIQKFLTVATGITGKESTANSPSKIPQLKSMKDVLALIERERQKMVSTNPLFPTLKDASIPAHIRMSFAPYVLYFAMNGMDILNHMKVDKPETELSKLEKRLNTFIDEDNFHYNFYLRDLEHLGYTIEKFGSVAGILRLVWAPEGLTTRKLIYSCLKAYSRCESPLMAMTICETGEGGLTDFFTLVHEHISKAKDGIDGLQYWGDVHINLELNHVDSNWFDTEKTISQGYQVPKDEEIVIAESVIDIMGRFDDMFRTYYHVIMRTLNGTHVINPARFNVKGTPPIQHILEDWKEIQASDENV